MGLVCSLSAALLATLVQRCARDHMHIFQRYSHPLKIARIRQYLHEGIKRWRLRMIAEAVPGLIHISLFLFFIGLADFLFSTYATVGKFTIIPIAFSAMLYIISTFAPVIYPQSPYRTAFSSLAWKISRPLLKHEFKDRFGGPPRRFSSKMADGQMQLAMEKNGARKGRDERAIRWLVENLTEDIEMESLASGIPGSFDAKWGVKVWRSHPGFKKVTGTTSSSIRPPPALPSDSIPAPNPPQLLKRRSTLGSLFGHINSNLPRINTLRRPVSYTDSSTNPIPPRPMSVHGEIIDDLCLRIQRLFETCDHRDSFINEDEWRRRSRACVETAASFVFCMGADISAFGNIGRILSDLGNAEKTREVSATSLNWSFISRWTCLSIVVIRKLLDSPRLRENASGAILTLGTIHEADNFNPAESAPKNARRMDERFVAAWGCVERLRGEFKGLSESDRRGGKVEETLLRYKPQLDDIKAEADRMKVVDECISRFQNQIDQVTHNLTRGLPGVDFDELTGATPIDQVFDFPVKPVRPQFLYLSPRLFGLSTLSQKRSSMGYIEMAELLKAVPISVGSVVRKHRSMERQLWRLQDLSDGGAFGFTLELYLLSFRRILSTITSQPREILFTFYVGALKSITSDWDRHKGSLGTLQIILNIVSDIAVRDRGIFSNIPYPDYITKELLDLLGNMVKGQANPYIDAAMEELLAKDVVEWRISDRAFHRKVVDTIESCRAHA